MYNVPSSFMIFNSKTRFDCYEEQRKVVHIPYYSSAHRPQTMVPKKRLNDLESSYFPASSGRNQPMKARPKIRSAEASCRLPACSITKMRKCHCPPLYAAGPMTDDNLPRRKIQVHHVACGMITTTTSCT